MPSSPSPKSLFDIPYQIWTLSNNEYIVINYRQVQRPTQQRWLPQANTPSSVSRILSWVPAHRNPRAARTKLISLSHRYSRQRVCHCPATNSHASWPAPSKPTKTTPRSDEATLAKYGLKANDAILAEEKHMGLYEDLLQNHDAKLIAGGAAQNTARGAQVAVPFPLCFRNTVAP